MKAVMLSLRPQWCKKIFNGEKTIEVRRTRPKLEPPCEVLVYETKGQFIKSVKGACTTYGYGRGKVIGSFVCDKVYKIVPDGEYYSNGYDIDDDMLSETCLGRGYLTGYGLGYTLYGWHITELKLFDKPRELGEFWLYNDELNKRYEHDENFCCYDGTDENGEATTDCDGENINNCYLCWEEWSGWCHKLTRPPQSWCYVEEQE